MGISAENVAARHGITCEQQDELAALSHQRAAVAVAVGRFKEQIVPVEIKTRKGGVEFDTDAHVQPDTTVETLSKMKPAFEKNRLVTAGNASGIDDGAVAVVLAAGDRVHALGLRPLARLGGYAHAGVEPGPKERDFDPAEVNPNGSGISLGHPVGATGAVIATKAIVELHRVDGRYAQVKMCIGGGQGIAAIFERVWTAPIRSSASHRPRPRLGPSRTPHRAT